MLYLFNNIFIVNNFLAIENYCAILNSSQNNLRNGKIRDGLSRYLQYLSTSRWNKINGRERAALDSNRNGKRSVVGHPIPSGHRTPETRKTHAQRRANNAPLIIPSEQINVTGA